MAEEIVKEIEGVLESIGQLEELAEPSRFTERIDALATIEFQILDRMENVMYMHGHQPALAPLYQRAAQHWRRLTEVNEALFKRLRDELMASAEPAVTVRRQIDAYVARRAVRDPVGYDDLDVFMNGLFGMDAEPVETRPLKPGMIGYQATPIRFILDLVERIAMGPDDVFVDLGSGLGRVALLVGLLTPAQVRGIEYDPGHCAYARQCAQLLPAPRVQFINADARAAKVADASVFFMYTPFRGHLLQEVLERLKREAQRRPLTIATYGPCTTDVAKLDWLALSGAEAPDDRQLAIFKRR